MKLWLAGCGSLIAQKPNIKQFFPQRVKKTVILGLAKA